MPRSCCQMSRSESPLWESNPRHQPYHGCALPTELRGRAGRQVAVRPGDDRPPRISCRPMALEVRLVRPADAEQVRAIYNAEVTGSSVTFDLVPRSLEDQLAWQEAHAGAHPAI